MAINLQKGQKINLSKESRGGLNKVMVGLGWDEVPQKRGLFAPKPQDIDCDAFAILLGYDGKLLNHTNEIKQCTVFFNNLVWPGGSIRHMGDNLTGAGEGDDEQIFVDLQNVPYDIGTIVFAVNIYDALNRNQHFGMMQSIETHSEIRLFCDLDHTLIYSHRVPIGLNKIAVEYLNGKEQSFMTQGTYDFLCKQNCVHLIPVTTRSKKQYERISVFHKELCCKYALICNGGILLVDGIEDPEWYSETLSLISPESSELQAIKELVQQVLLTSVLHDVCGLFFYIKHNNPALFAEQLRKVAHPKNICILHDRHKVYCLPSMLNKGNAIERFAKKFGEAISIAAGDSEFDIPMLARADTRIIPPVLEQYLPTENTITISTSVFSDGICNYLSTIAKRGTHKHE